LSRRRWFVYVATLTPATLIGLPMSGLIELYNLSAQPRSGWDWVIAGSLHAEFFLLLVLVILAWRKLFRAKQLGPTPGA
jgi:hypothetical protein